MPSEIEPEILSKQDRRRIYSLLKSRSIESYWEVGRILDALFVDRVPYKAWPKIEAELRAVGEDAPTSQAQLHQCRRISATWTKADVNAAMKVVLPWGHAINIVHVWSRGVELGKPELIDRCKKLVADYGALGYGEMKVWLLELKALQKHARAGNAFISKYRLLSEKRAAVTRSLNAATQMIRELKEFVPRDARAGCDALGAEAESLKQKVERFCDDNLEKLRESK